MEKILITGATGLIGSRLTDSLLKKGYKVNTLGRKAEPATKAGLQTFVWDVDKGTMDEKAMEGVNAIVHLAGASVAEGRWTDKRKKEIIDSRQKSANIIYKYLESHPHSVKVFISSSGIDYYGDCGTEVLGEDHPRGTGFLADVTKVWEESAKQFTQLGIREVRCRTGVVLAREGGALPELTKTIPLGVAPYFTKTPLFYSWIHIEDVCGIMEYAIENEKVNGAINTTAPEPLPIKNLMQEILRAKSSSAILTPVPSFALKIMLGEQADMLLGSHICSTSKIQDTGYQFKYPDIKRALKNIVH